ncbi:IS1634 family transposase [Salicibibacter halophilus]|uniref:IS1634 family transposase n=1 Tax=Salicibibacter halophilus TaxID=2502791 RepID=A0A514LIC1_9BACI|nr:IS1634 family transposase [Salicibibacter halophilus]QDI90424.1 IS1634 family transposase [Salicibibacter halophilus]QDI91604.1 IS1634 family transposase [Salicibibacter halophilus]
MSLSPEDLPDIQPVRIGSTPVIRQLMDKMGLIEAIDKLSPVKEKDCNVSVGTRVAAMIINQLSHRKALYRVQEFYQEQDVELLFGPGTKANDFNDDALGRALDALHEAGIEKVCKRAIQAVQAPIDLTWKGLHFDTTSFVYTGQPKNHPDEEDILKIVRGYSKDHRPDLPQFKFGLGTTPEGIPVYGDILDGNQDDKTWNKHVLHALTDWYDPEQLEQAIFISDSALVTQDNLEATTGQKDQADFQFLSRLPENFNLAKTLKAEALEQDLDQWEEIGALVDRKGAASYRIYPTKADLNGKTYRFLVIQSDHMDARKEKTIQSNLEKEQRRWHKEQAELERQDFSCEADAEEALGAFLKKHQKGYHTFEGTTVCVELPGKRQKRGRPKKGEAPPPPITVYRVRLTLHPPSDEQLEAIRKQASIFILVTSVAKDDQADVELLKAYKGQQTVENRFRFLKNPFFVGRVYLAKPKRVEAFACVMMISVMVYSLFEYLIRKNMEGASEPLYQLGGGGRRSFRPTGESVLELLDTVDILHMEIDGHLRRFFPKHYEPQLPRILVLLEMDASIFTEPRSSMAVESRHQ